MHRASLLLLVLLFQEGQNLGSREGVPGRTASAA
jgi:hypothetical protein